MRANYLTVLFFSVMLGVVTVANTDRHEVKAEIPHVVQNLNNGNHNGQHNGQPDRHSEPGRHPVSVPEPTSWMLLGLGLAGLGFAERICSKSDSHKE